MTTFFYTENERIPITTKDCSFPLTPLLHAYQNTYLCPITEESTKILNSQFKRLSVSITPDIQQIQSQVQSQSGTIPPGSRFSPLNINLNVFGHSLNVPEAVAGRRIARFTFQQLCDEALGAADYIHLAETFRIVFITGVPVMNLDCRNEVSSNSYTTLANNTAFAVPAYFSSSRSTLLLVPSSDIVIRNR